MNYSIFRIPLNLHSVQSQASVPVFLGDTSIQLRISLSDGVKPYMITDGCLAKISIKRPTGTHLEEFCSIENKEYTMIQDCICLVLMEEDNGALVNKQYK